MVGALSKYRFWILLVVLVGFDQATKFLALQHLSAASSINLIGSFISLQLIHNPGAAFSLGSSSTWIFTIVALVVAGFLFAVLRKITRPVWWVTVTFILSGAIGNLIDRLFQPPAFGSGHVVDFINYNDWFIGNVADIYIVVAIVFMCYLLFANVTTTEAKTEDQNSLSETLSESQSNE